jgi:hypothetical protein
MRNPDPVEIGLCAIAAAIIISLFIMLANAAGV